MQPKHSTSNRDVFSAQLWKAVGLQPRTLSIPRVLFFPEEAASVCCVPSSSRASDDRQGLHSGSPPFTDVHKRRRNVAYTSSHDDDIASEPVRKANEASYQAPDLEAMMQAPRQPRTLSSRRPLRDFHRLAAECPLPSMEPEEMSPAASGLQQQQYDGELRGTADAHSTGQPATTPHQQQQQQGAGQCTAHLHSNAEWQSPGHAHEDEEQCRAPSPSPACQQHLGSSYPYCEEDQPQIQLVPGLARKAPPLPGTSPEPPEARTSTKDSPASHSAESSLGVFLDLQERGAEQEGAEHRGDVEGLGSASPANSAGQDQLSKHQHHMAWSRGSPTSEDAD